MILRGGPCDGHKVDGRRVRGQVLDMKIGSNEFARYQRATDKGIYEFVETYRVLLTASPAGLAGPRSSVHLL